MSLWRVFAYSIIEQYYTLRVPRVTTGYYEYGSSSDHAFRSYLLVAWRLHYYYAQDRVSILRFKYYKYKPTALTTHSCRQECQNTPL